MSLVDEVKARLTIVDVVSDYLTLEQPSSKTPKALCPFHEERTPSFSVSVERDSWRCWGACAEGGDMFSFVMKADSIEFTEALNKLADKAGVERHSRDGSDASQSSSRISKLAEVNEIAAEYFTRQLEGEPGKEASAYLASRGIDISTARRRGIGYAPSRATALKDHLRVLGADARAVMDAGLLAKTDDGEWRDMFSNRITISIRDQRGRIVGFGARAMGDAQPKYLNTRETAAFNKSEILYGLDWAGEAIRTTGQAIIVEGYMDVIAAHERGFRNVVACMGTAVTGAQLNEISGVFPADDALESTVVLCLDADAAGQTATLRALQVAMTEFRSRVSDRRCGEVGIKVAKPVVSEHGAPKDPDEAIRHDPNEWLVSINEAEEILDYVIRGSLDRNDASSDSGFDLALNEIEPFFERFPPRLLKERRCIEELSADLGVDAEFLINSLGTKRRHRLASSGYLEVGRANTNAGRRRGRRRPQPRMIGGATLASRDRASWELQLLACMTQSDVAFDHLGDLQPYHFSDATRAMVYERMLVTRDAEVCQEAISHDADAVSLFERLREMPLIHGSPDDANEDATAAYIEITSDCANRTLREYLVKQKRLEVSTAKENDNMLRDDMLPDAVGLNRDIYKIVQERATAQR